MALFGGGDPIADLQAVLWQAYYTEQARQQQEFYLQQAAIQQQQEAGRQAGVASATVAAQQQAPYTAPPTTDERLASLNAVLPSGFETTAAPSSLADPFVEQAYTGARSTADEYLSNMLKRGTVTPSGYTAGQQLLESQAPDIRSKYQDIGNLLVSQEQAGLRDIAGQGQAAAGDLSQSFDPSTYKGKVEENVGTFQGSLPTAYSEAVSSQSPQIAFDVSKLGAVTGAAQSPQDISIDPYASNIGAKSDETEPPPTTKRKTSVF